MSIELRYSVYYSDTVEIDVNPSETLNLTKRRLDDHLPVCAFFLVSPPKKKHPILSESSFPVCLIFILFLNLFFESFSRSFGGCLQNRVYS